MKLRDSRSLKQPELMIIPMIDIMFFLLVFFMLSTMYMVDLKTIPIKLPKAEYSAVDTQTTFAVSVKKDGSIWLGDKQTDISSLNRQKWNRKTILVFQSLLGQTKMQIMVKS